MAAPTPTLFDRLRLKAASLLIPRAYYSASSRDPSRKSFIRGAIQSARFDASTTSTYELRRLSRAWAKNAPVVVKLIHLWRQFTVGDGIIVQPSSSDREWNRIASDEYQQWSMSPDIATGIPLSSFMGVLTEGWFTDGDSFALLVTDEQRVPKLQAIEAHLVKTPPDKAARDDVFDGIIVDPLTLRPLQYLVHSERKQNGSIKESYIPYEAAQVVHVFEPSRPGQLRGIPLLHAVLNTIHHEDDLEDLEMMAAKDAAATSKVVKTPAGEELDLEKLRSMRFSGTAEQSDGTTEEASKAEFYRDRFGADIVTLQPGDEYSQFASARPSVVTQDFWRYLGQKVCVGSGIPYAMVYPESVQGTVYRGILDIAAGFFSMRAAITGSAAVRFYYHFMNYARNAIPALRNPPADWRKIRIVPPRSPNVDQGYSSDALVKSIAALTDSWGHHYSSRGKDWRSEMDDIKEQMDYIKELGLEPQFGLPSQPAEKQIAEKADDDDEEKPTAEKADTDNE